jgi:hypothetical protein
VPGADGIERPRRRRLDPCGRRADVLQAEGDLGLYTREDDLILRILEDARDGSGKLCRPGAPRVHSGDLDAPGENAPVEVRDEPGERAQKRRLPSTRGAEEANDLAGSEVERHRVERRPVGAGVAVRQLPDTR